MKKRYLLLTIVALLFLTGCSKKLKCTAESNDESFGKMEMEMVFTFDKDTKGFKHYDAIYKITFDDEKVVKEQEDYIKKNMCDSIISTPNKKSCDVSIKGKVVTLNAKEVEDTDLEGKTEEQVREEMKEAEEFKCN